MKKDKRSFVTEYDVDGKVVSEYTKIFRNNKEKVEYVEKRIKDFSEIHIEERKKNETTTKQ